MKVNLLIELQRKRNVCQSMHLQKEKCLLRTYVTLVLFYKQLDRETYDWSFGFEFLTELLKVVA